MNVYISVYVCEMSRGLLESESAVCVKTHCLLSIQGATFIEWACRGFSQGFLFFANQMDNQHLPKQCIFSEWVLRSGIINFTKCSMTFWCCLGVQALTFFSICFLSLARQCHKGIRASIWEVATQHPIKKHFLCVN